MNRRDFFGFFGWVSGLMLGLIAGRAGPVGADEQSYKIERIRKEIGIFEKSVKKTKHANLERIIRWIPVAERLPALSVETQWVRSSSRVLTIDSLGLQCFGTWVDALCDKWSQGEIRRRYWQREITHYVAVDGPIAEVTHWAELPQAPGGAA